MAWNVRGKGKWKWSRMQAQKTCRKGAIFLRVYNIGANSSWLLPLKHVKGEVHDYFSVSFTVYVLWIYCQILLVWHRLMFMQSIYMLMTLDGFLVEVILGIYLCLK